MVAEGRMMERGRGWRQTSLVQLSNQEMTKPEISTVVVSMERKE